MALAQALLTAILLLGFCLGFAAFGMWILRALQFRMEVEAENVLVAVAVGIVATEILVFFAQITQHIRPACVTIVALLCALAIYQWNSLWPGVRAAARTIVPKTFLDRFLLSLISVVASVEFLASQAPLTGSDALHYHFVAQQQILLTGFHPMFSSSHSFLCGQSHLLILLGLALGIEHLAMGFLFLGGILTAACMACLISRWCPSGIVAAFSLLFLVTPVVFWQISSSGAPDIFMALLASAAVLVLRQNSQTGIWSATLVAGFLAGGIAGAKYTGCLIAMALAIAVAVEFRSLAQLSLFTLASLSSGIWPYFRNFAWTGNPVFPFLSARLSPQLVTSFAMASIASDTGASASHNPLRSIPFVFLAAGQRENAGFWDFFGPIVLALAPLVLLAFRDTRAWRIPMVVWFLSGFSIFFASGLPRFLLPIFPIALSCVAVGLHTVSRRQWKIACRVAMGLLILTIVAGVGGLVIYAREPVLTAVGFRGETAFLEQRSQEYQIVESVNKALVGSDPHTKTLVFIRHLYYLHIPYVNGDPGTSFELAPEHMQTVNEWREFFAAKGIGYVVRAPQYPASLAAPLSDMERNGDLIPYAQAEARTLLGMRIDQKVVTVPVFIFKIKR